MNSYAAHKTFYNTVVSKIDSLKREKEKKQKDEDAAAKALEFQKKQEEKDAELAEAKKVADQNILFDQREIRRTKYQKTDDGNQITSQSKYNSGKKGRPSKQQENDDSVSEDPDPKLRVIESLYTQVITKKREYKQAWKAWEAEKAKYPYLGEP